jgi:mannose-6-phosphate isomerase-like protein (cupin superfamily)
VLPLTRPGGIQAWKIVIPTSQSEPKPRTHDGFEWLYALSGRMRLVMGDQDVVLEVGEAAEFNTQVPHWFGSTGDGSAEVLSIFGRPERGCTPMHRPVRPSLRTEDGATPALLDERG